MVPNGWRKASVSEICNLQNGNSFNPKDWDTKGLPIIRIQNLNGNKNFNYFSGEPQDKWLVETGQILFSWAGSKGVSFGPFIWKGEKGVLNQHIYKVLVKSGVHKSWLFYILKFVTASIEDKAHGFKSTLVHVKKSDIDNHVVSLPPLSEQQKIAKIITTWDKAISTTERLIENSTQQKKALMQQLLMGKKRFGHKETTYNFQKTRYGDIPLDWEYPAIKDISVQLSKKNTEGKDYPVVSCSKHYGFVDSLDYFKKKVYSDDTSGYRIIPRNAFGFPSNHIEEGSIGVQTVHDIAIASPIYVVFKTDSNLINNTYLYALLKTEHYRQIFCSATNASVDRRGSLRWKEFSIIRIPLPPLEEQQKIANVLNNADKEIELLEQQLADLQQEKKALMQVLLTGKKRVTLND